MMKTSPSRKQGLISTLQRSILVFALLMTGCDWFRGGGGDDTRTGPELPPLPPPVDQLCREVRTERPESEGHFQGTQVGPGDGDHKGHPVQYEVEAVVVVSGDGSAVVIRSDHTWTENRPDHTKGVGTLYSYVEARGRVVRVLSPTRSSGRALVQGHGEHRLRVNPEGGPVAEVTFFADGPGNDFDGDGSAVSQMKFNNIRFEVEYVCGDALTESAVVDTITADFPDERVIILRSTGKVLSTTPL